MKLHKRWSLKCAICTFGIPLIFWFGIYILYWEIQSSDMERRVHVKARKRNTPHQSNQFGALGPEFNLEDSFFKSANLLDDEHLDRNHTVKEEEYDVKKIQELGIIRNQEDEKNREKGYSNHAFNELISDRLSLHRIIPDTRHELCREKKYPTRLPTVSIIICFFNEAFTALIRTVHSILDRSSSDLIHEIILVDDNSAMSDIGKKIDKYIQANFYKVKLLKTPDRLGLIRARTYGANFAKGQVIVFLDSHCEVNVHWLEPLLAPIALDYHVVTVPIIDIINPDTFVYKSSPLVRGGFNWGLHFKWDPIPERLKTSSHYMIDPIQTPTMAGGLFAMNRTYFHKLGEYDSGMNIWGGENLEISFRIWQCGGTLEIIPCSRVGHIFRKRRPYSSPNGEDTMMKNSIRLAKVWMDDYIEFFFMNNKLAKTHPHGDISDRLALRKRLNCKSFKWYLENIYPEQTLPDKKGHEKHPPLMKNELHVEKIIRKGKIQHLSSGMCLQTDKDIDTKNANIVLVTCQPRLRKQLWYETDGNELKLANRLCMDVMDKKSDYTINKLTKCTGFAGSQKWVWKAQGMEHQLYSPTTGKCLCPVPQNDQIYIGVEICSDDANQIFTFLT